jgi:DNA polymerase-3 subunit alpha
MNRELLVEGNSLMITLIKNYLDENKARKKINVKKIVSLKDVLNKPIKELKLQIDNIDELNKFKSLSKKKGITKLIIEIAEGKKTYIFQLNESRNLDHKLINSLKIGENILIN